MRLGDRERALSETVRDWEKKADSSCKGEHEGRKKEEHGGYKHMQGVCVELGCGLAIHS